MAAAERLQIEQEMAALTLRLEQLGVLPAAPAPHPDAEETQCVVCMDAAKDQAVRPCMHMCVKGCDQGVRADPGRPADPTHGWNTDPGCNPGWPTG